MNDDKSVENREFLSRVKDIFCKSFEDASRTRSSLDLEFDKSEKIDPKKYSDFFIFTVSSHLFRIILLLHFSKKQSLEQYVEDSLGERRDSIAEGRFDDAIAELGNLFTGAFKRDIGKIVKCSGMSTPVKLEGKCLGFIEDLDVKHELSYTLMSCQEHILSASLYVSFDHDVDKYLQSPIEVDDELSSGELELF